jgi:hypothetical protein
MSRGFCAAFSAGRLFGGPLARGFDFLGYRFRPEGLELVQRAMAMDDEELTEESRVASNAG